MGNNVNKREKFLQAFKEDQFFYQNSRGFSDRTVVISLVNYRFIASECCGKAILCDERFSIAISWTGGTMMSNVLIILESALPMCMLLIFNSLVVRLRLYCPYSNRDVSKEVNSRKTSSISSCFSWLLLRISFVRRWRMVFEKLKISYANSEVI